MMNFLVVPLFVLALGGIVDSGSSCPPFASIYPCYCTMLDDGKTFIICPGIQDPKQLMTATIAMKSMIVDRFILLGLYRKEANHSSENELQSRNLERLPPRWLSALRVKELEIRNSALASCFFCDESFESQKDFLSILIVTHSELDGHLCYTCNSRSKSISTKDLEETPHLKYIDFSFNNIDQIDGKAFPENMRDLSTINLSHNKIEKVNDNAFATLLQLTELDLSHNYLTKISRKMFRSSDQYLKSLDLSWNSIQTLPKDMFAGLNRLKEVKLNHNLLEVLHAETWTGVNALMEKIELKGNFITCNCTLSWVRRMSKNTKLVAKCITPAEVEFEDIKSTLPILLKC